MYIDSICFSHLIGIKKISRDIPSGFYLSQNYPNPFNSETIIHFQLPLTTNKRSLNAKLIVYDASGKEVTILANENYQPGIYSITFDGTNYASGVYYYKLTYGNYTAAKKMLLIK